MGVSEIVLILDNFVTVKKGTGKEHIAQSLLESLKRLNYSVKISLLEDKDITGVQKKFEGNSVQFIRRVKVNYIKYITYLCKNIFRTGSIREKLILMKYFKLYLENREALIEQIQVEGKPDLIFVSIYGPYISGLLALEMNELFGIKYIIWEHRSLYQRKSKLNEKSHPLWGKVLKKSSLILAVSKPLASKIENAYSTHIKNVSVLNNPVKDNFFNVESLANYEIRSFANGRYVFAGWQNWTRDLKRVDILIEAFETIVKVEKNICLIIAGSTPPWVEERVNTTNLKDSIYLLGKLSHQQMPSFVNEINACVICSDHETFGNQAVESLAAGKPVITTKCGGPESIINQPILGVTVEKNSSELLTEAILEMYENRTLYDSKKISEYCKKHYSLNAFERKLTNIFKIID